MTQGEATHWSDRSKGDAVINPLLADFSSSKPTTVDYTIGLGAYCLISGSPAQVPSGVQEMDVFYQCGHS